MSAEVQIMQYTRSVQAEQRNILATALNEEKFADVTIIIGSNGTRYHINRIFLSLISPVFASILYGEKKDNIIIKDIKPKLFKSIINFAYCNDPKITEKNVVLLTQICDKYEIKSLLSFCHQFFSFCLNAKNICILLTEVVQLNIPIFIAKCKQFIEESQDSVMKEIINSNGFIEMDLKTMSLFLKIKHLEIKEEELWSSVLKWAENRSIKKYEDDDIKSEEYRLFLLKSIVDFIRFGLMRGDYFAKYVVPQNVLNDKELIVILLYFQAPDGGCGKFNISQRMKSKNYATFGVITNKFKHMMHYITKNRNELNLFFLERNMMKNNLWNLLQKLQYLNSLMMQIK